MVKKKPLWEKIVVNILTVLIFPFAFLLILLPVAIAKMIRSRLSPHKEPASAFSNDMEIQIHRYADDPEVIINNRSLPTDISQIMHYAIKLGIGDDTEREYYINSLPLNEKKQIIKDVWPLMLTIEKYCDNHRDQSPVPDNVVLLDLLTEAVAVIYYDVNPA